MTSVIQAVGYGAAVFPFACVFGASLIWPVNTSKTDDLQGRPPPVIFMIIWTLICIVLTTLPLVAIATYESKKTIWLISLLVVIISIVCAIWLLSDYNSDNVASCLSLAVVVMLSLVLLITILLRKPVRDLAPLKCLKPFDRISPCTTQLVLASSMSLPITWGIYALMMNLTNANMRLSNMSVPTGNTRMSRTKCSHIMSNQ